jgi:murein DD-endopeptidase MepM/ murein hydrolase activator NlpD
MIEKRQALIEAALAGTRSTSSSSLPPPAAASSPTGPLARVEQAQLEQAALVAKALDVRYQVTAAEAEASRDHAGSRRQQGQTSADPIREGGQRPASRPVRQLEEARPASGRRDRGPVGQAGRRLAAFTSVTASAPIRSAAPLPMHAGIDLSGPLGTPNLRDGRRHGHHAEWNNGGYGNLVKIDHGRGIETRYGHLSAYIVLARAARQPRPAHRPHGLDRRSTGSHLHMKCASTAAP